MNGSRRLSVLFLALTFALAGVLFAQHAPPGLLLQLTKSPGTLRGEGTNNKPTGPLGLKSYRVHELALAQPVTVDGMTTAKAWRLTITGGPFVARALPATIEIDGVTAGVALESADQSELRLVTFDPAALHDGAQVTVAYGDLRFALPEKLSVK